MGHAQVQVRSLSRDTAATASITNQAFDRAIAHLFRQTAEHLTHAPRLRDQR
jgi:hypothetical protein